MARRGRKKNDADELVMNFIVLLLLLPFIGVFLLGLKDPSKKAIGGVLLVVGIIIWGAMGCGG